MSADDAIRLLKAINCYPLEPLVIVKFSSMLPTIPALIGNHRFDLNLFFKEGLKHWSATLPLIVQMNTIFTSLKSEPKAVVAKAFALGYYDLYDSLVTQEIGKLDDKELLQALLDSSDIDVYLRYDGPKLYEDYTITHTAEEVEALHIRNKL